MKKITLVMLVLAFALALTACAGMDMNAAAPAPAAPAEAAATETAADAAAAETAADAAASEAAAAEAATAQAPAAVAETAVAEGGAQTDGIGLEWAKEAALAHAGISAADAVFTKEKYDIDDGRPEYDIEFYANATEYEYEIDAATGEILNYDVERDGTPKAGVSEGTGSAAGGVQTDGIGLDRAKEAALAHAGVSAADAVFTKEKYDIDDGRPEYDIEFYANATEYEYEIDAATGEILNYDVERDGTPKAGVSEGTGGAQGSAQTAGIGLDRAKEAALAHAGVGAADAVFTKEKYDIDDGRPEYDIEFYANGTEYEYEIDAATGGILSYDAERGEAPKTGTSEGTGGAEGSAAEPTGIIGKSEAGAIALARVAGASGSDMRIKLDKDDGRTVYEGEIIYGGYEYDFEIDAKSGAVLEWDSERHDEYDD